MHRLMYADGYKMAQASRRMGVRADEYADTQRDRQTDKKHISNLSESPKINTS